MAASTLHVAMLAAVLLLPSLLAPVAAHPKGFCLSQFAIASQACSVLPPSEPEDDHHRDDGDDEDDHKHNDDNGDRDRRRHTAITISSDDDDGHRNSTSHRGNRTRGSHRRRHRRVRDDDHDHNHDRDHYRDGEGGDEDDEDDEVDDEDHDEELRAYRDCCRWLKEVEKACVCEALLRLPPFLVKPQHRYTVRVGRTCRLTYKCGGGV